MSPQQLFCYFMCTKYTASLDAALRAQANFAVVMCAGLAQAVTRGRCSCPDGRARLPLAHTARAAQLSHHNPAAMAQEHLHPDSCIRLFEKKLSPLIC